MGHLTGFRHPHVERLPCPCRHLGRDLAASLNQILVLTIQLAGTLLRSSSRVAQALRLLMSSVLIPGALHLQRVDARLLEVGLLRRSLSRRPTREFTLPIGMGSSQAQLVDIQGLPFPLYIAVQFFQLVLQFVRLSLCTLLRLCHLEQHISVRRLLGVECHLHDIANLFAQGSLRSLLQTPSTDLKRQIERLSGTFQILGGVPQLGQGSFQGTGPLLLAIHQSTQSVHLSP
mmetsp:Transcript_31483/g.83945  ORF Transcript_31483/g.83945 Transcript_31483/m.83945 type:complete len:231 (+) Transcript_31483:527-1219(+)